MENIIRRKISILSLIYGVFGATKEKNRYYKRPMEYDA